MGGYMDCCLGCCAWMESVGEYIVLGGSMAG